MLPLLLLASLTASPMDFNQLTEDQVLDHATQSLAALGTYRVKVTKEERIGKKLVGPQVLDLTLRERPFAARLQVLSGPNQGRKVVYDSTLKANELRVRESGLAGALGGLWLKLDNPLTRGDTNHPVTHLGFGHLLEVMKSDVAASKPFGGRTRTDEGLQGGLRCFRSDAPAGARVYAKRSRICFDPVSALPMLVEVYDDQGLLERHAFAELRSQQQLPADHFTPDAFGI